MEEAARTASFGRAPDPARRAVLVLGMHRSGTSATAGMLALLGARPPRTLEPGDAHNPRGYWESRPIMAFNERFLAALDSGWDDWRPLRPAPDAASHPAAAAELAALLAAEFGDAPLLVIKDPRICRLLPFWRSVLAGAGIAPCAVLPQRAPAAVARSLGRRDAMDPASARLLWLRHVLEAEAASRDMARCLIRYDDLLADWRAVAAAIGRRLGLDLRGAPQGGGAAAVDGFLSPDLRRAGGPEEGPGETAPAAGETARETGRETGGETGGEAPDPAGWVAAAAAALDGLCAADADAPAGVPPAPPTAPPTAPPPAPPPGSTGPDAAPLRARLDALRAEIDRQGALAGAAAWGWRRTARARLAELREARAETARAEAGLGRQGTEALAGAAALHGLARRRGERLAALAATAEAAVAALQAAAAEIEAAAAARLAAEARAAAAEATLAALRASPLWRHAPALRRPPPAHQSPGPRSPGPRSPGPTAATPETPPETPPGTSPETFPGASPGAAPAPGHRARTRARTLSRRLAAIAEPPGEGAALLDPAFYAARYPDVARSGLAPLDHYLRFGRAEGRLPSAAAEAAAERAAEQATERAADHPPDRPPDRPPDPPGAAGGDAPPRGGLGSMSPIGG